MESELRSIYTSCFECETEFETLGDFLPGWNVMEYSCPECGYEMTALDWYDEDES